MPRPTINICALPHRILKFNEAMGYWKRMKSQRDHFHDEASMKFNRHITMTSQWARWRLKSSAHGCLLNRLFRRRSMKTSKLRVTGLCEGNSPVTGEFPSQRASNAENLSIWWRHHASYICGHRLIILRLARNYQCYLSLIGTGNVEGCRYSSLRSFKWQYVSRLGPVSIWRPSFPGMGIHMLKIKPSWDRLIFNMGIPTLVKRYLCIETDPALNGILFQRHYGACTGMWL